MTYEKKFFHKGLGFGLCCCDPCDELIPGGTVPEYECQGGEFGTTEWCYYKTEIPAFALKADPIYPYPYTLNDWGGVTVKPSSEKARLVWEFSSYKSGGGGVFGGGNKDHWIQNLSRLFFDFEAGKMTWELDGPLCSRPGLANGPMLNYPLFPTPNTSRPNGTETRTGNPQHIWTEKHFALDEDGALKIDWCRRYDHFALYLQGDAVGLFPADLYDYSNPHPGEYHETRSQLGVDCLNLEQWAAEGSWTVDWYNYRFHGKGLDKQTWFDSCNHFDATVCDRGRSPSYLYKVGKNAYDKRKIRRIKAKFSGLPSGYERRFFENFGSGAGFDLSNLEGQEVTLSQFSFDDTRWMHPSGFSWTANRTYHTGYWWGDGGYLGLSSFQLTHQTLNPQKYQYTIQSLGNTHPPADGTPLDFWNIRHADYPVNKASYHHSCQTEHSLYVPEPSLPLTDQAQRDVPNQFWSDWFEFDTGFSNAEGLGRTGLLQCYVAVHAGGMVRFDWLVQNELLFTWPGQPPWQTFEYYNFNNFWQVEDRDDFILVDNHNGISDMVLPISGNLPDPGYFDDCTNQNRPDLTLALVDSLAYVSNCLVTLTSDDGGLP